MNNFCVSLTSIPSRLKTIKKTLNSIFNQELLPKKTFLNLPRKFKRFKKINYDFSELKNLYTNLEITECDDYGPGTKLLGSIHKLFDYDYVVLVDDDHLYNKEMLKIFYEQGAKNLEKAYSFCVYDIIDCKVGQGADGFMINTKFLKNIDAFFNSYVKDDEKLFFHDDLWISIYINKVLKKEIQNLFPFIKKKFFFNNKSIYKKHTQIDALIETYSTDRKKARNLKYNESLISYKKIRELTKNFEEV